MFPFRSRPSRRAMLLSGLAFAAVFMLSLSYAALSQPMTGEEFLSSLLPNIFR